MAWLVARWGQLPAVLGFIAGSPRDLLLTPTACPASVCLPVCWGEGSGGPAVDSGCAAHLFPGGVSNKTGLSEKGKLSFLSFF